MAIGTYLSALARDGKFSGTVLARSHGTTLVDSAYGYADRERQRASSTDTAFQLASVSKQFTAAAIVLLRERGKLSIDDRLSRWLPGSPPAWQPITIHQLLTHTSGAGHWEDYPDLSLFQPRAREDLIGTFFARDLRFPVGSTWYYSSPAYVLLAHIVEQASDERYAEFLQENIFRPLGMSQTSVGDDPPAEVPVALGYSGEKRAASFDLDTVGIGAGDIWSTTHDVTRWIEGLAGHEVLNASSVTAMWTRHANTTHGDEGYGYGWMVETINDHPLIGHTGGNAGFTSFDAWLPDQRTSVVLLCNDDTVNPGEIGMHMVRRVLGAPQA
ncbi:MAG: serine hydrolase domain-containing protein [Chloroflexota bacterium]